MKALLWCVLGPLALVGGWVDWEFGAACLVEWASEGTGRARN